ncbi:hypothetical protein HMPREF1545_02124 [Oscillibacter sp. KLE 1728]|nr:hypothetical protein HMPREF1545_02124 [Oscillibacter sp. KLE 1728]
MNGAILSILDKFRRTQSAQIVSFMFITSRKRSQYLPHFGGNLRLIA